ncbi:polyprenyl synthetase family protein [Candidatus Micrarchaeota archaeon]|nr:polyprenyl synthetase family protein [Candidatus Micrarchaeota archaeon]
MQFYDAIAPELAMVEKEIERMLAGEPKEIYGMLLPFIKRGGKRIRPALATLCCRAVGGKGEDAVFPGALIEMFHNFTLIHDDIEDDSQFRRGEPTLHRQHGIPIALNSGDALYTLIWKRFAEADMDCGRFRLLQKLFLSDFKRVVEGQGLELDWERGGRFDITEKQYFDMITRKTAALMGLSCETGAFLGGADDAVRRALRKFGEDIGIAFQIQDDVLNVTGEFEKYQKEIGGDITEGKRTLMVVHCLDHATPGEKKKASAILSSHTSRKEDLEYVMELFRKYGSTDYAHRHALRLVEDAKKQLICLRDSEEKKMLVSLADFVVKREK